MCVGFKYVDGCIERERQMYRDNKIGRYMLRNSGTEVERLRGNCKETKGFLMSCVVFRYVDGWMEREIVVERYIHRNIFAERSWGRGMGWLQIVSKL